MWRRLSRPSNRAGEPPRRAPPPGTHPPRRAPPRQRWDRSRWRRIPSLPRTRARASLQIRHVTPAVIQHASTPPASRRWMPSSGPAACRAGWDSRCAETSRAAGPRLHSGLSRRLSRAGQSPPGWISRMPSIRSRRWLAASSWNGSWLSPRRDRRRAWRSRDRSSPAGPLTSSSWICHRVLTGRRGSPIGWADSPLSPVGPGSPCLSSNHPGS